MGRFHRHRQNFNPRFPRGKRPSGLRFPRPQGHFNPRFPRGKRPKEIQISRIDLLFQSTLPAREATSGKIQKALTGLISIHASREGSDTRKRVYTPKSTGISIHASREGSDINYIENCIRKRNFNPRFPRGKRRFMFGLLTTLSAISIHASREGSDKIAPRKGADIIYFNPRFPRGKRHAFSAEELPEELISIHASREGSDKSRPEVHLPRNISIHASREGSDPATTIKSACAGQFQSTLPAREATTLLQAVGTDKKFQSTLPAREATIRHSLASYIQE